MGINMIKRFAFILFALFAFISTAYAENPVMVDFRILGAVIAPTKYNGAPWDGLGRADTSAMSKVSSMMAPGSGLVSSQVIAAIGDLASQGNAAPDVIGYLRQVGVTTKYLASVAGTPMALATKTSMTHNSYTPAFDTGYMGWPIFKETTFEIRLWDADLTQNDDIATVEITYKDIMAAIKHGKSIWLNVSDQGLGQLLYIHITASKSIEGERPRFYGYRWQ